MLADETVSFCAQVGEGDQWGVVYVERFAIYPGNLSVETCELIGLQQSAPEFVNLYLAHVGYKSVDKLLFAQLEAEEGDGKSLIDG